MSLPTGMRLGRYEIDVVLGAGGMGEVYRARDLDLGRLVALKVLPDDVVSKPDRVRRFIQEARAASALSHPNIAHVYEVGRSDERHFIAMEYVQGETLRDRLNARSLTVSEALDIACQATAAVGSAHGARIVHRDIKPENIMVRPDGYVKVLDFGLAKLLEGSAEETRPTTLKTEPGTVMGTVDYMSPEQLRGLAIDERTDVFSLGAVLYEMFTGRAPFDAPSKSDRAAAVLTREPDVSLVRASDLRAVIAKAMAKDREQRYASARALLEALTAAGKAMRASSGVPTEVLSASPAPKSRRKTYIAAIAVAVIAAIFAVPATIRMRGRQRATAKIPQLERLIEQHHYFEAFDLANDIRPALPADERVLRALQTASEPLTVRTSPSGARVFLRRYEPPRQTSRMLLGATPLDKVPVPRGDFILTIEKEGYATVDRPLSLAPLYVIDLVVNAPPPIVDQSLQKSSAIPSGMISVPGGAYRLVGWQRPTEALVTLNDFFLDRCEVSNAQFADFVTKGGYHHREFWKVPFVKDGKTLSFDDATALMHDTTGLPGPRDWTGQRFPEGRGDYPVSGVTWYEAAAYAEFAGKKLPTIFQWDKASRNGTISGFGSSFPWGIVAKGSDIRPRANLEGTSPMPVDSMEFGLSAFGALHMAGNVAEWCRNPNGDGFATRGGAFDDSTYSFGLVGEYPGFYSSPRIGFRCVRETSTSAGDQGAFMLAKGGDTPRFTPVSDAEFQRLRSRYDYEKAPLNARVTGVVETDAWRRERISFTGVKGRTAIAYLYLPKHAARPLQIIHFVPAIDVSRRMRSLPEEMEYFLAPFIRGGRAAFGVVLQGYIEREPPPEYIEPSARDAEYGDRMIDDVTELRRGLDYLETRADIDATRLAYFGPSAGADFGLIVAGVDHRYQSLVLEGAGLRRRDAEAVAVANKINYAPRIEGRKLMLNGKYDEVHPLRTDAEPLFQLLREPKKFVTYEGGHAPVIESTIRITTEFLDKTLGPVRQ